MLGALCSHPMLRLANWDPWRPMEEVVGAIKAFVEANGRVVRAMGAPPAATLEAVHIPAAVLDAHGAAG
jgi:hypothetical protein